MFDYNACRAVPIDIAIDAALMDALHSEEMVSLRKYHNVEPAEYPYTYWFSYDVVLDCLTLYAGPNDGRPDDMTELATISIRHVSVAHIAEFFCHVIDEHYRAYSRHKRKE